MLTSSENCIYTYIVFIFMIHSGSCRTCRTDWNCRQWWFLEYCPSTTIRYELVICKSCWWEFFFRVIIWSKLHWKPRQVSAMQKSCMCHMQLPSPIAKENICQMPHPNSKELMKFITGKEQVVTFKLPYKYVNCKWIHYSHVAIMRL